MKSWKKMLRGTAIAAGIGAAAFNFAPQDAYASEAGMEYMREVVAANVDTKSVHVLQDVNAACSYGTGKMTVDCKCTAEPMVVGGTLHLQGSLKEGNIGGEKDVPFYIEQAGKEVTLYFQWGDQWKKFVAPMTAEDLEKIKNEAIKESASMEGIKDVDIVSDSPVKRTLSVTLDGQKIKDTFLDCMKKEKSKDLKNVLDADTQAMIGNVLFDAFDGLTYTETVDKATKAVVASKMDLTGPVQKIANAVFEKYSDKMPIEQKVMAITLIPTLSLKLDGQYDYQGEAEAIVIPAEARNAVDITPKKEEVVPSAK